MARSISYGIGQYRFNPTFNYIDLKQTFDGSHPDTDFNDISYYRNSLGRINYQDVLLQFKPPTNGNSSNSQWLQYNQSYYVELTVPQHKQYDIYLDLKLCAEVNNTVDTERYQSIKQLIIPATPQPDDFLSKVLLFEDPSDLEKVRASVLDNEHILDTVPTENAFSDKRLHEAYQYADPNSKSVSYWYVTENNTSQPIWKIISNKTLGNLTQGWKVNETGSDQIDISREFGSTITFKFAFSPKFNLSGGFPYLLLETDRTGNESYILQYTGDDGVTYQGTCLDINQIKVKVYQVSNLLLDAANGLSQIQAGTELNHIAVWGHPEQILTINGEEIKIGKSGFYELKDFNITNLGIVVEKQQSSDINNVRDTFTIDYEYKITN